MRIEPNNIENHMLLGRLYRLNNDLLKAENEFKTAVALQPNSEEAVTTLAYLYNEEGDSKRAAQVLNAVPEVDRARQALFRARLHLRAAEGLQERDRRLSSKRQRRQRQSGSDARAGAEPAERRSDRRGSGQFK